MELTEARTKAEALMRQHGLVGWRLKFDNAVRRAGQCNQTRRIISLSKHITELNGWGAVRNTVLHEIAHALVGNGHGHDQVWKQKAAQIGAEASRTTHSLKVPAAKWVAYCDCQMFERQRRPKSGARCASCGTVLKFASAPGQ